MNAILVTDHRKVREKLLDPDGAGFQISSEPKGFEIKQKCNERGTVAKKMSPDNKSILSGSPSNHLLFVLSSMY